MLFPTRRTDFTDDRAFVDGVRLSRAIRIRADNKSTELRLIVKVFRHRDHFYFLFSFHTSLSCFAPNGFFFLLRAARGIRDSLDGP